MSIKEDAPTTDWLRARVKASPQAEAVVIDGQALTFSGLDKLVTHLSSYLAHEGVQPGNHVALLMSNSLAVVCSVFAVSRLGAVLVPLNTRLTAAELSWQVERADCGRLLCLSANEAVARAVVGDGIPVHALPESPGDLEAWLDTRPYDTPALPAICNPDSLQAIQFTSGTTGFPKGAMITHANHFWSAVASAFQLGVYPEDRWLVCLPLYHVGGIAILFRSCLYGTAVVVQNGFDAAAVMASLQNEAINIVSLVPTMLQRLLEAGLTAADAPALRLILLGGAAASHDLLRRASAAGLSIAVTYGLTEAASQVATMLPLGAREKPGSPGRALLFSEVNIIDDSDNPVSADVPGEIIVRGPTVMAGYYADPQATAATLKGGWLHTGDIGYLDREGDLWVLDRRSDLIVSGGENVYPAEIERTLRSHPAVASACVVGLPHPDWGRQVAAMVVLRDRDSLTAGELLDYCRTRLAGFKQPRVVVFRDELPLTGSGKIHRRAIVDEMMSQMESI